MDTLEPIQEETLDPRDAEAFRQLAHRMLDGMIDYLDTVGERPAWQPIPDSVRESLREAVPRSPQGAERVYAEFVRNVLPYPQGNIHPRFWGWVNGTGSPLAMLADMLASGMNPNAAGMDQSSVEVERQVLDWFKELMGFPGDSSGLLLSGASMANLNALTVARNCRAGFDLRQEGLNGGPRLTVYASQEVHSSVLKAVEVLGLGRSSLRLTPTCPDMTADIDAMRQQIRRDRGRGLRPFCVVATAGTVNTGAIDDLDGLADLCREEGLWLHVDGAFGALAALSPQLRPLVKGMERADSLAFDLHKWMYLPYDIGCVLVRRGEDHRRAFKVSPSYLRPLSGGVSRLGPVFSDHGIELSRAFRALKVWMSIKAEGVDKFGRLIEQNVRQAQHLAERIRTSGLLRLEAPVPLNVVCFRFAPQGLDDERCDDLNQELLVQLQERGIAVPSSTLLKGRFCLRVAVSNHRTRLQDMDLLVEESIRIGKEVLSGYLGRTA